MTISNDLHGWLSAKPRLAALNQVIRTKIPAVDVDDVVQSTLADALTAREPPPDPAAFDRWLFGIARHKIADYYRRHRRHEVVDSDIVAGSICTEAVPDSANDLLRWVDRELPLEPETTRTLEWMMREADGDPLETIAKENDIAAPTVRQRVSRLRRYLRERWALQVAAALGLFVVVTGLFAYRQHERRHALLPDPARVPSSIERAVELRKTALEACRVGEWKPCIDRLDRAKLLDPAGDVTVEVQAARSGASRALTPITAPSPSTTPMRAPSPSATPAEREAPERSAPQIKSKSQSEKQGKLAPNRTNSAPLPIKSKAAYSKQMPMPDNADPLSQEMSLPVQNSNQLATPRQ
ncbi:MAG TPA: sigma-70 family RNA polymerase sigma factor [Polyangiaceae bacterium]